MHRPFIPFVAKYTNPPNASAVSINRFCQFMPVCTSRYISRTCTHARTHGRATFECIFHCFPPCRSFIVASRAHTARSLPFSLSPSLPFSLFVRASHGSIIRYVSNFRLSEFFARSFRIIPAALRKKYRRVFGPSASPSAIFPLKPIFIYHEKCLNFCTNFTSWQMYRKTERGYLTTANRGDGLDLLILL